MTPRLSSRRLAIAGRRLEPGQTHLDLVELHADLVERALHLGLGDALRNLLHLHAGARHRPHQAELSEVLQGGPSSRATDGVSLGQLTLRRQPRTRRWVPSPNLRRQLGRELVRTYGRFRHRSLTVPSWYAYGPLMGSSWS